MERPRPVGPVPDAAQGHHGRRLGRHHQSHADRPQRAQVPDGREHPGDRRPCGTAGRDQVAGLCQRRITVRRHQPGLGDPGDCDRGWRTGRHVHWRGVALVCAVQELPHRHDDAALETDHRDAAGAGRRTDGLRSPDQRRGIGQPHGGVWRTDHHKHAAWGIGAAEQVSGAGQGPVQHDRGEVLAARAGAGWRHGLHG